MMAKPQARIEWLDCGKGICIILVVMLYAVEVTSDRLGHAGWLQAVADFARPFRMPDFFLLSGLLLPLVIDRPWRRYVDRKVVHFAYFYLLWLTILYAYRAPPLVASHGLGEAVYGYFEAWVKPYSMLWFIYMLAIFFVVTRWLRRVHPLIVWVTAAGLHLAAPDSVKVVEKFTQYYVFFFTGYACAGAVFEFARRVQARPALSSAAVALWALLNGVLVFSGLSSLPGLDLILAFAGSAAVIAISVLISPLSFARGIAYCGAHSIVVYLAFYIPLTATRKALSVAGVSDPGSIAAISTAGGVLGALAMYWAVRRSRLRFLFERPGRIGIDREGRPGSIAPAEGGIADAAASSTR
jgi:uncharacterized membrane protein YcfT